MDVVGLQKRQTPGRETRGLDVANGLPYAEFALKRESDRTRPSGQCQNPYHAVPWHGLNLPAEGRSFGSG